jgi:hypothetical protein
LMAEKGKQAVFDFAKKLLKGASIDKAADEAFDSSMHSIESRFADWAKKFAG